MSIRLTVHDPAVLRHVIEHPARGRRFTVRELATKLGENRGVIARLRTGSATTVDAELGRRLAVAVGVHPNVLFVSPAFPGQHTTSQVVDTGEHACDREWWDDDELA